MSTEDAGIAKAALAASLLRSMMSCRGTDRISSSNQRSTRRHALVIHSFGVGGPIVTAACHPGRNANATAWSPSSSTPATNVVSSGKVGCDQFGIDVDLPERGLDGTAAVEGNDDGEERDLDPWCTPMHNCEGGDDPVRANLLGAKSSAPQWAHAFRRSK